MEFFFRHKEKQFQSLSTFYSIILFAIGTMSLVIMTSLINGFEYHLERNVLRFIPQVLITTSDGKLNIRDISNILLEKLLGVVYVAPLTTGNLVLHSSHGISTGVMLGINPDYFEPLSFYLQNICINELVDGQYRIIIGKELSERLEIKIGDNIRLIVPDAVFFTPLGQTISQRLFTVIDIYDVNKEINSNYLLVHQNDASKLMLYPEGYVTGCRIWLKKPLEVAKFCKQSLPSNLLWKDWREYKGDFFQSICLEKKLMIVLISLIILISILNIIFVLGILVFTKNTDIAILRTYGLPRLQVVLIFMIYAVSISIIGNILGGILGIIVSNNLNVLLSIFNSFFSVKELPFKIEMVQVFLIIIYILLISCLIMFLFLKKIISESSAKVLNHVK